MRICVITYYEKSGGGTWGTALHTVRGVGSGSRDVDAWTQTFMYAEDRGTPSTDDPGAYPVTSSGKAAPGPDPGIRHRTQIGMFRPIRMDHTNCLQVAIKTHKYNFFFSPLLLTPRGCNWRDSCEDPVLTRVFRTGCRKKIEWIRINLSHLDLVPGLCRGSRAFQDLEPW